MTFYLSVPVWGTVSDLAKAAELWGRVPFAGYLLTYPYLAWSKETLYRVVTQLAGTADNVALMLDSGGFIAGTPKLPRDKSKQFTPLSYLAFVKRYAPLFTHCLSWDNPQDAAETYRYYTMFLKQGVPVTPVWHIGEGLDLLEFYAQTSPTGWLAIGGFGSFKGKDKRRAALLNALATRLEIVRNRHQVQIHCLGLGFNKEVLSRFQPDAADSTAPLSWRYGYLVTLRDNKITRVPFSKISPSDLPPGMTVEQFHQRAKNRVLAACYWALRINAYLNLVAEKIEE